MKHGIHQIRFIFMQKYCQWAEGIHDIAVSVEVLRVKTSWYVLNNTLSQQ